MPDSDHERELAEKWTDAQPRDSPGESTSSKEDKGTQAPTKEPPNKKQKQSQTNQSGKKPDGELKPKSTAKDTQPEKACKLERAKSTREDMNPDREKKDSRKSTDSARSTDQQDTKTPAGENNHGKKRKPTDSADGNGKARKSTNPAENDLDKKQTEHAADKSKADQIKRGDHRPPKVDKPDKKKTDGSKPTKPPTEKHTDANGPGAKTAPLSDLQKQARKSAREAKKALEGEVQNKTPDQPAPKANGKTAPQQDTAAKAKAKASPAPKPDTAAKAKAKASPAPKPDTAAKAKAAPKPDTAAKAKTSAPNPDTAAKTKSAPKSDTAAKGKTSAPKSDTAAKGKTSAPKSDTAAKGKTSAPKPSPSSAARPSRWSWWNDKWWFDAGNGWEEYKKDAQDKASADAALSRQPTARTEPGGNVEEKELSDRQIERRKAHHYSFLNSMRSLKLRYICNCYWKFVQKYFLRQNYTSMHQVSLSQSQSRWKPH